MQRRDASETAALSRTIENDKAALEWHQTNEARGDDVKRYHDVPIETQSTTENAADRDEGGNRLEYERSRQDPLLLFCKTAAPGFAICPFHEERNINGELTAVPPCDLSHPSAHAQLACQPFDF